MSDLVAIFPPPFANRSMEHLFLFDIGMEQKRELSIYKNVSSIRLICTDHELSTRTLFESLFLWPNPLDSMDHTPSSHDHIIAHRTFAYLTAGEQLMASFSHSR